MKSTKIIFALVFSILILGGNCMQAFAAMTPYTEGKTDGYFNGATYVLPKDTNNMADTVSSDFSRMKDDYNINTISVYDLENFDKSGENTNKDILFDELKKQNMKIVVRIEYYDSAKFAFSETDSKDVIKHYEELIKYVCEKKHRNQVAYFALNMPVDDASVQKNSGGINSENYLKNQVTYAEKFTKLMREETAKFGFTDAKMFLSVFYGWDNSYKTPSYASAKADGYFINNYSYPKNSKKPPDEKSRDEDLINSKTLKKGIDKFSEQYGNSPLVIEYGFHTVEYNDGVISNQTAGLVKNRQAKERALIVTKKFYDNYPFVKGMMYFGYNLFKNEGTPAMEMDWALYYSFLSTVPFKDGKTVNKAEKVSDKSSAAGTVMLLNKKNDGAVFENVSLSFAQILISCRAEKPSTVGFYVDDNKKTEFTVETNEKYISCVINVTAFSAKKVSFVLEEGEGVYLESMSAYSNIEAENFSSGTAGKLVDKTASQNYCVSMVKNHSAVFNHIRGGTSLKVCYKAPKGAVLSIDNGETVSKVELPAVSKYTEISFKQKIIYDGVLEIKNIGDTDIRIDYINASGIGNSNNKEVDKKDVFGIKNTIACVLSAVSVAAFVFIAVCVIKIKKKRG